MTQPKTFLAVDVTTGDVVYTHSVEAFKKPYTDDNGVLHWFGYASDEVLAKFNRAFIYSTMIGHFKEWCARHNFSVGEAVVYVNEMFKYATTEYEILAPLMENA